MSPQRYNFFLTYARKIVKFLRNDDFFSVGEPLPALPTREGEGIGRGTSPHPPHTGREKGSGWSFWSPPLVGRPGGVGY